MNELLLSLDCPLSLLMACLSRTCATGLASRSRSDSVAVFRTKFRSLWRTAFAARRLVPLAGLEPARP